MILGNHEVRKKKVKSKNNIDSKQKKKKKDSLLPDSKQDNFLFNSKQDSLFSNSKENVCLDSQDIFPCSNLFLNLYAHFLINKKSINLPNFEGPPINPNELPKIKTNVKPKNKHKEKKPEDKVKLAKLMKKNIDLKKNK